MKKFLKLSVVLASFMLTISFSSTVFGAVKEAKFNLLHNGVAVDFTKDDKPINVEGRTLLPLKTVFEVIDTDNTGKMNWVESERKVEINKGDTKAVLYIDSNKALVNGEEVIIDGAVPMIYNNRTYVPLRFVADTFGLYMNWDKYSSTAAVADKAHIDKISEYLVSDNDTSILKNKLAYDVYVKGDGVLDTILGKYNFKLDGSASYKMDLSNSFMYANVKGDLETVSNSENSFIKGVSTNKYSIDTDMYFDKEDMYVGKGDEYIKAGMPTYFSMEDILYMTEEYVKELPNMEEYIDYSYFAGLSLNKLANGDNVLEGNIVLPDGLVEEALDSMGMGNTEYVYDKEIDDYVEKKDPNNNSGIDKLHIKQVYNGGKAKSAEYKIGIRYFANHSKAPSIINIEFGVRDFDYDAKFESVVPDRIKEIAEDIDDYGYDYGDEDYYDGYDYYGEDTEPTVELSNLNLEVFGLENTDLGAEVNNELEPYELEDTTTPEKVDKQKEDKEITLSNKDLSLKIAQAIKTIYKNKK